MADMKPVFFRTPAEFRRWLAGNHARAKELPVGYYRKDSGRTSITWPESVDEALCFGWIDGIRRRLDEASYAIRFTPRRRGSNWSDVNIRRAQALIREGRMRHAGLMAFRAGRENRPDAPSHGEGTGELPRPYARILRKNKAAWGFFRAQPPSHRKAICGWIVRARREETRLRRLEKLASFGAQGKRLPELTLRKPGA
ncbi:MAG: YdeI/OmpD-associated family protein [Bacteroidota bacterium]